MVQFNFLVIAIGIIFSLFLYSSFISFQRFHERVNPFRNWDLASLASANRVSKESSEFLSALQASYKLSIEAFQNNGTTFDSQVEARNTLLEEFSTKLTTALPNTINQGLNFNNANGLNDKQKYQDYSYSLIHSNYVPASILADDKKYTSTLISEDKVSADIDAQGITTLNDSGKLRVTENLLKALVGASAAEIIKANQSHFGTEIASDGLDLTTLPTGVKLNIKYDSDLAADKTRIRESKLISTAQIRIDGTVVNTTVAPPVIPPAVQPVNNPPVIPSVPVITTQPPVTPITNNPVTSPQITEIEFSLIPADKRAIVYDPTKPINKDNPIRIINTKEGGYSVLYVADDGYINVGIGDAKTNSVNTVKGALNANTTFSSATLTLVDENANTNLANSSGYSIKMDTLPRGKKRYTTTDTTFAINGITIPKGFIIVGTKAPETGGRPILNKFDDFRVYDPESGALITYFGANAINDKNKFECRTGSCFDFNKFYTEPGTKHMGADLYEFFSVAQLFPSKTASQANQLWINVQSDIERDTKLNINSGNEAWQDHILKDLNDDEMVYLGHELRYEDLAHVKQIFGFQDVVYKDDYARKLDDAQFRALMDYARAKQEYWDKQKTTDTSSLIQIKEAREELKKLYEQSRIEFNNYMKYGILPDRMKPAQSTTNTTTQSSTSNTSNTTKTTITTTNTNGSTNDNGNKKNNDSKSGGKKKK